MASLQKHIILAAVVGLAVGSWVSTLGDASLTRHYLLYGTGILGNLFVDLLKMIMVPLIFTSIVVGIANLQSHHKRAVFGDIPSFFS